MSYRTGIAAPLASSPSTTRAAAARSEQADPPSRRSEADFARQLMSALRKISSDDTVSEEELFAAVAKVRLDETLDPTGKIYFQEAQRTYTRAQIDSGRLPSPESIVKSSLNYLEKVGQLSHSDRIALQRSFSNAAQLDGKKALYDQYGGPNDPTVATTNLKKAAKLAASRLNSSSGS